MSGGWCPIRRGLLDHLATMGPRATAAYLCLHLLARATGTDAGTVLVTERRLAELTGMSAGAAHQALRRLQPRYLERLSPGRYRITNWRPPGACPAAAGPEDAQIVSTALSIRAACSHIEQDKRNSKRETGDEDSPSPYPLPRRQPSAVSAAIAAETAARSLYATAVAAAPAPAAAAAFGTRRPESTGRAALQNHPRLEVSPHVRPADQSPPPLAPCNAAPGQAPRVPPPPPRPQARVADPRHAPLARSIRDAYRRANGRECPWDGRTARRLSEALAACPTWQLDDWLTCVRHRALSHDLNQAEAPVHWVGSLADYLGGPLDRYHRPLVPRAVAPAPEPSPSPSVPDQMPDGMDEGSRDEARRLWQTAIAAAERAAGPQIGRASC